MASQNRKDILAALATQIQTEATNFELVSHDSIYWESAGLPSDKFPACIILDGPARNSGYISKTESIDFDVRFRIMADSDTSQDELYDLSEAIIDAINTDLTLGGTCIKCINQASDPPLIWPSDLKMFFDFRATITYWRDIA